MKTIKPIGFKFPTSRLEPKHTVPDSILEQHPWHWDPMKKDHTDKSDSYMGVIGQGFDWEALAQLAISRANEQQHLKNGGVMIMKKI